MKILRRLLCAFLVAGTAFIGVAQSANANCNAADSAGNRTFYLEVMASVTRADAKGIDFQFLDSLPSEMANSAFEETFMSAFHRKFEGIEKRAADFGYKFQKDCVARTTVIISPFPFSDSLKNRKVGDIWEPFHQDFSYDEMSMTMAPPDAIGTLAAKRINFLDSRPVPCGVDVIRRRDGSNDLTFWISIHGFVGMHSGGPFKVYAEPIVLAELSGTCAATVLLDMSWSGRP